MTIRSRGIATVAALALALSTLAVVSFSSAAAADPPPGYSKYANFYDGKCLEADLGHLATNGDVAQLWSCWNDPGNQQWQQQPTGRIYANSPVFKLMNRQSHKCLEGDLSRTDNGTPVQLWDCWNDPGNQQWYETYIPATLYVPIWRYRFVNLYSGLCLDANLGQMRDNPVRMQLWQCWNDPGNDQWTYA